MKFINAYKIRQVKHLNLSRLILLCSLILFSGVSNASKYSMTPSNCRLIADTNKYVLLDTEEGSTYWLRTGVVPPIDVCASVLKKTKISSLQKVEKVCEDYEPVNLRPCNTMEINTISLLEFRSDEYKRETRTKVLELMRNLDKVGKDHNFKTR